MQIERLDYTVKYPSVTVNFVNRLKGDGVATITESDTSNIHPVGFIPSEWVKINKHDIANVANQGYNIWYIVGRGRPAAIYRSVSVTKVDNRNTVNVSPMLTQSVKHRSVGCINDTTVTPKPKVVTASDVKPIMPVVTPKPNEVVPQGELAMAKIALINRMLDMVDDI